MEKIVQPPAPPPQPPVPPSIPQVCPRVTLTDQDIDKLDKEGLILKWKELDNYVTIELGRTGVSTTDDKLHLQQQEATRKENVLMMRLATKEQEMQELLTQVQELKQAQTPSAQQLQTMLIDPAVNLLFEKMKTELTETKDRLEQAQNDLSAWKFTPDSVTGKKLMAKCRTLIQENQELGKQLSQGRIAQLEAELSLQKKYSEELKGSQDEMNEFVIQLDEEVEGMQATICALQQQLKEAKQRSDKLGTENQKLRTRIEELLSSKQTNNEKQDSAAIETLDNNLRTGEHSAKRTDIRSPERNNKQERTANKQERTKDSTTSNRELLSPANNREHLSPSSKNGELLSSSISQEERMEVDGENKKESTKDSTTPQQKNESNKKIDHKENSENRPPQKTVITRRSAEKKNVEASNTPYVSPPKGVTKTSFSINDLLAGGKGCIKKDGDSPTKFSTSEHQAQENGENGALNGEIDDSVI